jgi:molecular chaperone GrpE
MTQDTAADPRQPEAQSDAAETPQETIARLEEDLATMKDRALRALAEAENTRRQAERQREESVRYAVTGFARDLLNVADNLSRALQSSPPTTPQGENDPFVTGVAMTERELLTVFERHGIRKVDPTGQPFDHNQHQAVVELPGTGAPAGQVVQVIQPGYLLHDRLLRPALVAVASGEGEESGPISVQV